MRGDVDIGTGALDDGDVGKKAFGVGLNAFNDISAIVSTGRPVIVIMVVVFFLRLIAIKIIMMIITIRDDAIKVFFFLLFMPLIIEK